MSNACSLVAVVCRPSCCRPVVTHRLPNPVAVTNRHRDHARLSVLIQSSNGVNRVRTSEYTFWFLRASKEMRPATQCADVIGNRALRQVKGLTEFGRGQRTPAQHLEHTTTNRVRNSAKEVGSIVRPCHERILALIRFSVKRKISRLLVCD